MLASHVEKLLVSRGLFSPEEVQDAQTQAGREGETLLEYLGTSGRLPETDLLDVQARLFGLELWSSIPEDMVDQDLVQAFPIGYLKKHRVVPLRGPDGAVTVAMDNAAALDVLKDFSFVLGRARVTPVLAPSTVVIGAINRVFGSSHDDSRVADVLDGADEEFSADLDDERIDDLLDDTSDAPFIKLVNMVLAQAVRAGASDVHIEPYKDVLRVRFRLDGVLYDKHSIAKRYHAAIVSRIKIMAKLNIAEKRLPQDGRMALAFGGRQVDLRVSSLPTAHGERIVLRLLEKDTRILSMSELGLGPDDLERMKRIVTITHGIVLVTGPTGSGKTTTLYAVLNHINTPDKNILTIEDPVEYQIDGVGQMQVNSKIDLTFARGLRTLLRQDPDVVLIGEIRDKETADIAVQAALTGHLVFATLHTNDAPSAVTRLIDMGVEPFLLSSVLRAVAAQRLIRVLCPACRTPYAPDEEQLLPHPDWADRLRGRTLYEAAGCDACMATGYKGRKAVYEFMEITDDIRSLINRSAGADQVRRQALADGMHSLRDDGFLKILAGQSTMSEILRVTNL